MVTKSTELDAWNWMSKITEKLTFIRLSVIEKREISEEDYDLLKIFYRVWSNGEFPLYETKMHGTDDKAVQTQLFGRNDILPMGGTVIANGQLEL